MTEKIKNETYCLPACHSSWRVRSANNIPLLCQGRSWMLRTDVTVSGCILASSLLWSAAALSSCDTSTTCYELQKGKKKKKKSLLPGKLLCRQWNVEKKSNCFFHAARCSFIPCNLHTWGKEILRLFRCWSSDGSRRRCCWKFSIWWL